MINSPCKLCVPPDRYIGCHGECEKYKNFKIIKGAENAKNKQMSMEKNQHRGSVCKAIYAKNKGYRKR